MVAGSQEEIVQKKDFGEENCSTHFGHKAEGQERAWNKSIPSE